MRLTPEYTINEPFSWPADTTIAPWLNDRNGKNDMRMHLSEMATVCFGGWKKELTAARECMRESVNGADQDRTGNPCLAKAVLSQLSYGPLRSRYQASGISGKVLYGEGFAKVQLDVVGRLGNRGSRPHNASP